MAISLGLLAALLFFLLCSTQLDGQGLYCDELHQAAEAFPFVEGQPEMFTALRIGTIPVLNMSYSGAIKTNIYKLYLKFINPQFTVSNWRTLGILFSAAGIWAFCLIAGRSLPLISLLAFVFLLLTDSTILLASRHDFGPVALAFSLRLLFLALWLRGESQKELPMANSFFIGMVCGLAIFEKLSSVVLLLPLSLIVFTSPARRSLRHLLACLAGGLTGGAPLLTANLYSFFKYGSLISLSDVSADPHYEIGKYLLQFFSLGSGDLLKEFILGVPSSKAMYLESLLIAALLLLIACTSPKKVPNRIFLQQARLMTASYFLLMIGIYSLPKLTYIHHWLIATPFHYLAIVLACTALYLPGCRPSLHKNRIAITSLLCLLIASRCVGIISLEHNFQKRLSSADWSPSLTQIGLFAARQKEDTVFFAADWGVSPQMHCLSNGRPFFVYELFKAPQAFDSLMEIVNAKGKKTIYVVEKIPKPVVYTAASPFIFAKLTSLANWQEVKIEHELTNLEAVRVRKFTKKES